VTERGHFELELDLMLGRIERIWEDLLKSKLSEKEKNELYHSFCSFLGGFAAKLEEKHPYLREKPQV
jgi:hypothetical protein